MNESFCKEIDESVPGGAEERILNDIVKHTSHFNAGVDARRFRALHYEDIESIDRLVQKLLIREDQGSYFLSIRAIQRVNSAAAGKLLADAEALFQLLKVHYFDSPGQDVSFEKLSAKTGLSIGEVAETVGVMVEATQWWEGRSAPIDSPDSSVRPGEKILSFASFAAVIAQLKEWSRQDAGQTWPYAPPRQNSMQPVTSVEVRG